MKITINKKSYELKYSLRAMMMYENITDKTFNPQGLTDIITFFYCIVLTSTKDYEYKFEQFIDLLDLKPEYITEFGEWIKTVILNNGLVKKN